MSNQIGKIEEISLEQAIEGPLLACNDAQKQLSELTYKFLCEKMWSKDGNTFTPVNMVFNFPQGDELVQMRIPLMSLLPIPSLQINQFELNYQAQVTDNSSNNFNVKLVNEKQNIEEESKLHSYLNIHLRAGISDIPMGLAKFYQILNDELTTIDTIEE